MKRQRMISYLEGIIYTANLLKEDVNLKHPDNYEDELLSELERIENELDSILYYIQNPIP